MSDVLDSNTHFNSAKINLPSSGGILAMGIISIVMTGLVGLILGIIAISTSKKPLELYRENPERYNESSYNQLKAGRTCGIIGLSLSSAVILIVILVAIVNL